MYNAVVPSFPKKKQPPENSWGVTRLRQPKATCHWTVLVHEFQSTLCMSLQNFTGLLFHKLLYVPAVQSHCWLGDLVSAAVKLSQVSQFGHGGVCVSTGVWIKNKKKTINQPAQNVPLLLFAAVSRKKWLAVGCYHRSLLSGFDFR